MPLAIQFYTAFQHVVLLAHVGSSDLICCIYWLLHRENCFLKFLTMLSSLRGLDLCVCVGGVPVVILGSGNMTQI